MTRAWADTSTAWYLAISVLLLLMPALICAEVSCHLHPPAVDKQLNQAPGLIGPFSSAQRCAQENVLRYRSQGRCHCSLSNPGAAFSYKGFDSDNKRNVPLP